MAVERKNEYYKWIDGRYPYDRAECGECAAGHGYGLCHTPAHAQMIREAEKLKLDSLADETLNLAGRKTFAAFRKKFARFYPKRKRTAAK